MQFGILGPLEVRSPAGETIVVGGPRPRALLVILLLNAGRVVGVDQLIDGQYGDAPPGGAVNAVQAQVARLRRALSAELIEFHGTGYRLAIDPDDVDVHRFERLAREGRRLVSAGRPAAAAGLLREALDLWRGSALADLPFRQAQVAWLEELRLTATEDLVEAELALPEGCSVAELQRLVAAHPLRERLSGQLMRALQATGRQAEASAVFEEVRRRLAEELGADPSPELAAVHLSVLRAERPAPRQRLAAQLTSFVGRERELERIDALRDSRLITITGPGGTGKTRLAIEAAGRTRREVCFVDLSPLDGGDQVPQAVLGALGLREISLQSLQSPPDLAQRLVSALAEQELLLILDNCEHVIVAAATLARGLLSACPKLSILATGREPLGITGETLVSLAPLPIPPRGSPASDALAYPAVRLFADRAAAVRQGFEVRQANVEAVTRICSALDGLPLAIELAAARLRSFTVEEIATRLAEDDRFRLLSRGDRTAAARHRTLHAVVEWSWDLLTPEEQTLARRFAVFAGSASSEAVEAVCEVEGAAGLLADLVDKSLIEMDGGRYRMINTIMLFCAERSAETGERERLAGVHARYFLDLAQRADPHLRRSEQLRWLARLSAEHGNLMAALRWAVPNDRETALRLIAALAAYWWLSGRRSQAGEAAAELLGAIVRPVPGLEEEYVVCVAHAVPRALPEHWARAKAIMRSLDRPLRHPFTAALWGMVAGPSGPMGPETERLLGADPWNVALGRLSLALLALLNGEPAMAERELREVLARFRSLGERWGTAQGLDSLAMIASWRGEWARARELWAEALELLEELGALEESADVLGRRAEGLVREGDLAAAAAGYRLAGELARKAGQPGTPAPVDLGLGEIARLEGDPAGARPRFEAALRASETGAFGAEGTRARVLTALARLAEAEGEMAEARLRHREALATARRSPLTADLADAAEGQAGAALMAGTGLSSDTDPQPGMGLSPDTDPRAGTSLPSDTDPQAGMRLPSDTGLRAGTSLSPDADPRADMGLRASLLLGVAVALRGTTVAGDRDVARIAADARDLIGAEAFASAFARGAAMRREEALTVLGGEGA
ncbi:BTAD domain-containing putative transcriptional regulator [Streptosporangium sp. 'caverna']|uniref:BTAD domain-containing putative transcriptional regulator n=1 Tax=Streptosporangium sp. 'caverna' TaxID=2202249 RepID=UPI000D7D75B8|nr:BTAD domain-containing putative transcriptional regulator [Streptosporangium sp. 'caverna']AWS43132.1 AfsR family transcriptional regulator [Streptosporangium sp. 'caverna']